MHANPKYRESYDVGWWSASLNGGVLFGLVGLQARLCEKEKLLSAGKWGGAGLNRQYRPQTKLICMLAKSGRPSESERLNILESEKRESGTVSLRNPIVDGPTVRRADSQWLPPSSSVEMQRRTDLLIERSGTTERVRFCEQSRGRCTYSIGVRHTDFADQPGIAVGGLSKSGRVSGSGGRGGSDAGKPPPG